MEKNKVTIDIFGKTYELKLGFKAIKIAESKLNKGVLEIYSAAAIGSVKFTDLITILWACVYAQDKDVSYEKFFDGLDDADDFKPINVVEAVTALVENSFPKKGKKEKGDKDSKN